MTRTTQFLRISVVIATVLALMPASAWGPRAQRTITGMAIQVIQSRYPDTFRPGDVVSRFTPGQANYERDVLNGADDGWDVIARDVPINSNREAIMAISTQIELLSDVRPFGAGSYYAYRLGALSSLIADLVLPYGLAWTPEQEALQTQIETDIEKHLPEYGYTNYETRRTLVSNPAEYFGSRQQFFEDNLALIADDYKRGRGYNGLLKQSSKAHFETSIEAISDVWFTILEEGNKRTRTKRGNDLMQQYFVDEIAYQLEEKRNFHQAGVVYENLASLNPTNPRIFETVGDLYHAFDTERGAERSVREWRIAYEMGGPERTRVAKKIADHFLREGRELLEEASEKGKGETELPAALASFKQAMQFNRTSEAAASLIQSTNKRIAERNERREMIIRIIAKADEMRELANNQAAGGNYGNAIPSYRQSIEILGAVDDEFTDQQEIAQSMKQDINKSISTAITNVMDAASAAIDEGERLEEQHKYDEAEKVYARIPSIVQAIPDDHNSITTQDKNDILALAERKVEEVRVTKQRWEESQRNRPGGAGAGNNAPASGAGGGQQSAPPAARQAPAPEAPPENDRGPGRRR